ncbi:hypothetical protein HAP47_0000355 [Bradyrhizobium sp. 41S5]|uniref:hypothetical protein n=1 Tax=Bradyrhizobium sp. 41S5 TaxID=1404443 RepID=UPI0015962465|nr:hypothetical protein [Bradyrhizobium sp. 41S5]UFX45229.1 hypothetical protein HAP47_0000355 [Bradyrhizobium sp. 41S5]
MLVSEEKLVEIAEAVAAGQLAISRAAIQCGVARRTLFNWLQQSQAGDERYLIRWPGDEPIPFHRALAVARNIASLEVRGNFERRCLIGHEEPVFFQGKPSFVEMEECVGLDEDTREMLGYPRDGILRDRFGRRVQHTITHAPPVAAVVKFLESRFPDEYRPRSDQNINVNGGLNVGVMAVPVQRLPTRSDGPPPVPPPPRRPTIAAPIAEAEFTEVEPGPSPMAVVGTEPIADPVDDAFQPPQPTTTEVVIREAPPPAYQPTASAGMSNLQRDLLARLRGDPMQRSANPIGSVKAVKPLDAGE